MTADELKHRILELLTHSPLTLGEITTSLRGLANMDEVNHALRRLEVSGQIVYLSEEGLWKIGVCA